MTIYKEYLSNVLIESVRSIFDEKLQTTAWKEGDYKMYADFPEVTMSFKEDCEPVLNNYRKYGLSKQHRDNLLELYKMVDAYSLDSNRPSTEAEILTDPRWNEIRKHAKKVYKELIALA